MRKRIFVLIGVVSMVCLVALTGVTATRNEGGLFAGCLLAVTVLTTLILLTIPNLSRQQSNENNQLERLKLAQNNVGAAVMLMDSARNSYDLPNLRRAVRQGNKTIEILKRREKRLYREMGIKNPQ